MADIPDSEFAAKWAKRLEREKRARQAAEKLLEQRSLQLHQSNESLRLLTAKLQSEFDRQTQELRLALDKADSSTRAKTDFLANLSHEVRTPLNAIIGLTRLLRRTTLTGEQDNYLQLMQSSSSALLDLLNDVLDFSKLEAGKVTLEAVGFSLWQWAEETITPYSLQAQAKGVSMHLDIDPALPEYVLADPGRMRQVLVNLLSNAVKFTKAGRIQVRLIRLEKRHQDSSEIVQVGIKITDTGIGISKAQQDKIFDAFTQADASTTRRYGGTGLGLAICQRLVNAMGGKLSVVSEAGKGSAFRFNVPVRQFSPEDRLMTQPQDLDAFQWRGLRVLVAEDQPINQLLMRKMLESSGCDLAFAPDGAMAVAHWSEKPVDLILMDVQMPVMDGLIATAEIRRREAATGRRTKIIALTAHAMDGDEARCLEAGMDGYVTKPVTMDALNVCVREVLNREPTPQNLMDDLIFPESKFAGDVQNKR